MNEEMKMTKIIVDLTIQGSIKIEEDEPHDVLKMELIDADFAKELKLRRLTKGLTMVQLSKLSGVSASHIGRIERGERVPSYKIMVKLKKALEKALEEGKGE